MSWLNQDFTKSDDVEHFLKDCVSKKLIPAGSILQISSCVNLSLPRKNKEAESTLSKPDPKNSVIKVVLTDGKSNIPALSDSHPKISSTTVPGTKIEIVQDIPIVLNFILLTPRNTNVIGGVVPALAEQWNMQLQTEKLKSWSFRSSNTNEKDNPPLWKPFSALKRGPVVDAASIRNVKAMDIVKQQESQKGDADPSKSKFDAQRQVVISELAKQKPMKQFGEGKKLIDKGVQDIMNEGFTEEEAEEAIRKFKNPQKALKYLKGTVKSRESGISRQREAEKEKQLLHGGRKTSRKDRDDDDGPTGNELGLQPSNTINLFGFIEAKIKKDNPSSALSNTTTTTTTAAATREQPDRNDRYSSGRGGGSNFNDSYYDRGDRGDRNSDRGGRYSSSRGGVGRDTTTSNGNSFKGFRSDRWDSQASQGDNDYSISRGGGRGGRGGRGRGDDRGGSSSSDGPPSRRQNDSRYSAGGGGKPDRSNFANTIIKNNHGFSRPQQQPQSQQQRGNSSGFDGLQSSNFPSLVDEPPTQNNTPHYQQQQQQQQNRGNNNGYHNMQSSQHQQYHQNSDYQYHQQHQQQQQQQYQRDDNYSRHYQNEPQQQQRGVDNGYRSQQQQPSSYQQHYQPPSQRTRGGYDQYESKRIPPQQQPQQQSQQQPSNWRPSGMQQQQQQRIQDQGYDQFNRQFSNLSMQQHQQQQQADYSRQGEGGNQAVDDYVPRHTMVFSRSKNSSTTSAGGNNGPRHRY